MSENVNEFTNPAEYPEIKTFGNLLDFHIKWGTRPKCSTTHRNPSWKVWQIVAIIQGAVGGEYENIAKNLRNWRAEKWPTRDDLTIRALMGAFFDDDANLAHWKKDFEDSVSPLQKKRGNSESQNVREKTSKKRPPNTQPSPPVSGTFHDGHVVLPSTTIQSPGLRKWDETASIELSDLRNQRTDQFYAEPDYVGSHPFLGRTKELAVLDRWADQQAANPMLLIEAMGGSGKSILAWEWLTKHASDPKFNWSGRYWYSFYEGGATITDFVVRCLSFMTGRSIHELQRYEFRDLKISLINILHKTRWLIVLDGVERLLVRYHRFNAAHIDADEELPDGDIDGRDRCATIRESDGDFLRALLAVRSSKIVVTSRLAPKCLFNATHQPLPGLAHMQLGGLTSDDAEAMLKACGIQGNTLVIRRYLQENCGNHPLVIGVLAGIILNYIPCAANFDDWLIAPAGGLRFSFSNLNLIARKNHILAASLDALPEKSWDLLATLAFVSSSVDYRAVSAFNPYRRERNNLTADENYDGGAGAEHELEAPLIEIILDLESRGLISLSRATKKIDLHPVIRGNVSGKIAFADKEKYGERVIDYFSSSEISPFLEARDLKELHYGIDIVKYFIQIEKFDEAYRYFHPDLYHALMYNLEEYHECASILRSFFHGNWGRVNPNFPPNQIASLLNAAQVTMSHITVPRLMHALDDHLLDVALNAGALAYLPFALMNKYKHLFENWEIKAAYELLDLCRDINELIGTNLDIFTYYLLSHEYFTLIGNLKEAESYWVRLNPMGRAWPLGAYRAGEAELNHARWHFENGSLDEDLIESAKVIASKGASSRRILRGVELLHGNWLLKKQEFALAAERYGEAVRSAREVGIFDGVAEVKYLEAKCRSDKNIYSYILAEISQFDDRDDVSSVDMAELCFYAGDFQRAERYARQAYIQATADGGPFIVKPIMNRASVILEGCGKAAPAIPLHNEHSKRLPIFDQIRSLINVLTTHPINADLPDAIVRQLGHHIHKLKAKDTTGRWAYYFVFIPPKNEAKFLNTIEGDCTIDLENYGRVIGSCYGEKPSTELVLYLKNKYGFDV